MTKNQEETAALDVESTHRLDVVSRRKRDIKIYKDVANGMLYKDAGKKYNLSQAGIKYRCFRINLEIHQRLTAFHKINRWEGAVHIRGSHKILPIIECLEKTEFIEKYYFRQKNI